MDQLSESTGRKYKLFDCYGSEYAEYIIIAMGSASDTICETKDNLNFLVNMQLKDIGYTNNYQSMKYYRNGFKRTFSL